MVEPVYRHPLPVRLWHWLTVLGVALSLLTGLLIFNIHPNLYWGEDGHAGMPTILSLSASGVDTKVPRYDLQVGAHHWDVTGKIGAIDIEGSDVYVLIGAPWKDFQFGATRTWHFLSAWLLTGAVVGYAFYLMLSGRLLRVLLPSARELSWRNLAQEIWSHMQFKRPIGAATKPYNVLQKLSYVLVIFLLIPTLILSGLTLSNTVTAVFPDLFSLFGGRQSARSMHFFAAMIMVLFIVVHLVQVFVVGFFSSTRSIITGRMAARGGVA